MSGGLRQPEPRLEGSPFEGAFNPFGAPLFFRAETSSTMQDAREIARLFRERGEAVPHGSVALAGRQSAGRGRLRGRSWNSPAGESLLCTVILCGPPANALTLRAGLAASETFDSFLGPAGKALTQVKWPNDVLYKGKKLSGILCEADGDLSYVGAGLNIWQKAFPKEIEGKATSLALILGEGDPSRSIGLKDALESFLFFLGQALADEFPWREKLTKRLFMLNEDARFLPGSGGESPVEGIVRGVGDDGALLIETKGGIRTFYSGELSVF